MTIKKIFTIASLLLLSIGGFCQTSIMTYNIRYNNKDDGDNWWGYRKTDLTAMLKYYHPDFLGVQEALYNQLQFIDNELKDYKYIGVGRDDGNTKGEFSAILYNTKKYKLVQTKTYWLSETPDQVSVGWDASMERITTFGIFENIENKHKIYIFNCHFDHIGKVSRKMSAKLILRKIKELGLTDKQVVVMGDFNSEPQSPPIQVFKTALDDSKDISISPHYGPSGTFNNFNTTAILTDRIDYIFTKNTVVLSHRHIDDRRNNNLYPSDHIPVFIVVKNN